MILILGTGNVRTCTGLGKKGDLEAQRPSTAKNFLEMRGDLKRIGRGMGDSEAGSEKRQTRSVTF